MRSTSKYKAKISVAAKKKAPVLSAVLMVLTCIKPKVIKGLRFGIIALDAQYKVLTHKLLDAKKSDFSKGIPKCMLNIITRSNSASIIVFRVSGKDKGIPIKSDVEIAESIVRNSTNAGISLFDYVIVGRTESTSLLDCVSLDIDGMRERAEQLTLSRILEEYPKNWPPTLPLPSSSENENIKLWAIDLFAGCGGLSLGLEQAGFTPLLVSELNKDAMATYLENRKHLGEGITQFYDVHAISDERLEEMADGWNKLGIPEIDLIAGGPPCQGFSGIGHRRSYSVEKEEIPSNHLFKEMTRIISKLRPKMFLFENVKGLLSAHWTSTGEKGEIWKAVQEAFRAINGGEYFVDFKLVHAKDYGVPQNRPRVLMVGIRKDLGWAPIASAPASGLLPEKQGKAPNIEDMLSDLIDPDYIEKKETTHYLCAPKNAVQKMLRTALDGKTVAGKGAELREQEYSDHKPHIREKFEYMLAHNGEIPLHMQTKKFAQRVLPRVWGPNGPTMTVTSLPEDYVHYEQPRALTVREWARLQMFPDWYEFKGARTTGGVRRAGNPHEGVWDREVPKYTQIGNAVPVELARKVGLHIASILKGLGS